MADKIKYVYFIHSFKAFLRKLCNYTAENILFVKMVILSSMKTAAKYITKQILGTSKDQEDEEEEDSKEEI